MPHACRSSQRVLRIGGLLAPAGEAARRGDRPENTVAAIAGDYYFGDGLGVNCSLKLGPDGRFSFGWRGCLGVYDQNAGAAKVEAGHLILKPERPNVREGFRGTATDFIPVRWGGRLYLIPEGDGREFCNAVNQGTEPRDRVHGRYYLRRDDWEKKVKGRPDLPKAWEPLLLRGPLRGRVIEVQGGDRARVDLGSDGGVWKGMEFWMDAPTTSASSRSSRSQGDVLGRVDECTPTWPASDSRWVKVRSRLSAGD